MPGWSVLRPRQLLRAARGAVRQLPRQLRRPAHVRLPATRFVRRRRDRRRVWVLGFDLRRHRRELRDVQQRMRRITRLPRLHEWADVRPADQVVLLPEVLLRLPVGDVRHRIQRMRRHHLLRRLLGRRGVRPGNQQVLHTSHLRRLSGPVRDVHEQLRRSNQLRLPDGWGVPAGVRVVLHPKDVRRPRRPRRQPLLR
jgi:hypothetical protein